MSEATTTQASENTSQGTTSQVAAGAQTTEQSAASTQAAQQQQATEGQTTQTAAGKTEGEAGTQAQAGAPEKYEFKAPEGQHFDEGVIGQFSEVAKELKLPQDAAQKVLDKLAPALQAKQARVLEEAKTTWGEQARTDKEIGGDKLQENLAAGEKALSQFGTPELSALLKASGLAHHPEVVRLLARVGKATSDEKLVAGGAAAAGAQSLAQRMYPGMNP